MSSREGEVRTQTRMQKNAMNTATDKGLEEKDVRASDPSQGTKQDSTLILGLVSPGPWDNKRLLLKPLGLECSVTAALENWCHWHPDRHPLMLGIFPIQYPSPPQPNPNLFFCFLKL